MLGNGLPEQLFFHEIH